MHDCTARGHTQWVSSGASYGAAPVKAAEPSMKTLAQSLAPFAPAPHHSAGATNSQRCLEELHTCSCAVCHAMMQGLHLRVPEIQPWSLLSLHAGLHALIPGFIHQQDGIMHPSMETHLTHSLLVAAGGLGLGMVNRMPHCPFDRIMHCRQEHSAGSSCCNVHPFVAESVHKPE